MTELLVCMEFMIIAPTFNAIKQFECDLNNMSVVQLNKLIYMERIYMNVSLHIAYFVNDEQGFCPRSFSNPVLNVSWSLGT